jgi:hypothetical protein
MNVNGRMVLGTMELNMHDLENTRLITSLTASLWCSARVLAKPAQIDVLLGRLENALPAGWSRDRAIEERLPDEQGKSTALFVCRSMSQKVVSISLTRRYPDRLDGGQWIPFSDYDLAEQAVVDFISEVFLPAVEQSGLTATFWETELGVEPSCRLREFCQQAHQGQSSLDRDERRLWNLFIIAVHRHDLRFEHHLLRIWLILAGWSEDLADELLKEYRIGRQLLADYDEERPQA